MTTQETFDSIITICKEHKYSLFEKIGLKKKLPFKTKEAKQVYLKTRNYIEELVYFKGTISVFETLSKEDLAKIGNLKVEKNSLETFSISKKWQTPYECILVTENQETYKHFRKKGYPIELIHEHMISDLVSYDYIRAYDCPNCSQLLEEIEHCDFVKNEEELYLEKVVEQISTWKQIYTLLKDHPLKIISDASNKLESVCEIIQPTAQVIYDPTELEIQLRNVQKDFEEKTKHTLFKGEDVFQMIKNAAFSQELERILEHICAEKGFNKEFIIKSFPLQLDFEKIKTHNNESKLSEWDLLHKKIYQKKEILLEAENLLELCKIGLLLLDVNQAIQTFTQKNDAIYAQEGEYISLESCRNIFLQNPTPITYYVSEEHKGALLTGANSGGKTTLIEHIIQVIALNELGLPIPGKATIPSYNNIYYFAKSKGSTSKGAFETMLTQLSKIDSKKTLLLADEMEAVTEPSIASRIIASTCNYFISHNVQCIFATHLGKDILPYVCPKIRVDGIKALGINNGNILINHNPILGELANSTPELIIEKMAKKENKYLNNLLKEIRI